MPSDRTNPNRPAKEATAAYADDLRDCRPLSADDERTLARRMHAGDIGARDELIRSQLRWVFRIASKRAARSPSELGDIVSAGNAELVRRIGKFDAERCRLSTYTHLVVRQAMRHPSGTSRRNPIDGATSLNYENANGETLQELVTARDPDAAERRAVRNEQLNRLRAAMTRLDPRTQKILRERSEGRTAEAIGIELGVSTSRIGQIERRGIERLKFLMSLPRIGETVAG